MKIKAIKYNKNGLTRAGNTTPKTVLPKADLTPQNIKITIEKHYFKVTKKGD